MAVIGVLLLGAAGAEGVEELGVGEETVVAVANDV